MNPYNVLIFYKANNTFGDIKFRSKIVAIEENELKTYFSVDLNDRDISKNKELTQLVPLQRESYTE
jgi:hypothetical protein